MYCQYCGMKLEENSAYCSQCGQKVLVKEKDQGPSKEILGGFKEEPHTTPKEHLMDTARVVAKGASLVEKEEKKSSPSVKKEGSFEDRCYYNLAKGILFMQRSPHKVQFLVGGMSVLLLLFFLGRGVTLSMKPVDQSTPEKVVVAVLDIIEDQDVKKLLPYLPPAFLAKEEARGKNHGRSLEEQLLVLLKHIDQYMVEHMDETWREDIEVKDSFQLDSFTYPVIVEIRGEEFWIETEKIEEKFYIDMTSF